MEKVVQKFKNFEEADEADRAFYRSLTPEQRVQIAIDLHNTYYGVEKRLERVARVVKLEER